MKNGVKLTSVTCLATTLIWHFGIYSYLFTRDSIKLVQSLMSVRALYCLRTFTLNNFMSLFYWMVIPRMYGAKLSYSDYCEVPSDTSKRNFLLTSFFLHPSHRWHRQLLGTRTRAPPLGFPTLIYWVNGTPANLLASTENWFPTIFQVTTKLHKV